MKTDGIENNGTEAESGIKIHTYETDLEDEGIAAEESTKEASTDGETPKQDQPEEQAETTDKEPDEGEDEKVETPKKKTRAQRRIERLARENKKLKEQLKKDDTPTEKVDIDDFESYEEYEEALKKQEPEPEPEESDIDQEAFRDMVEDGKEEYEDFEDVAFDPNVVISVSLLGEVMDDDNSSEILYFLGKNPDEAERLSSLSGKELTREMGKLDLEAKQPTKKAKVSKAPEPIKPVGGASSGAKKTLDDDLSFEEHEALLMETRTHSQGGFI